MPKELTHILIARDVMTRSAESDEALMAETISKNQAAFFLGAIIPDAFFYDIAPLFDHATHFKKIARALHSKNTMKNIERAKGLFGHIPLKTPMYHSKIAFAAGVVTHVVADRIIHEVIDHYVFHWKHKGSFAMATHREFETWMDMVLLDQASMCPRDFQLKKRVDMPYPLKHCLLGFYLDHVVRDSHLISPCRSAHLARANKQQIYLLRLFSINALFPVMAICNKLTGGRLSPWSSLFYPRSVTAGAFSILKRLDTHALTNGRTFKGTLCDLVNKATIHAMDHIRGGMAMLV